MNSIYKYVTNMNKLKIMTMIGSFLMSFIELNLKSLVGLFILVLIDLLFGIKVALKLKKLKFKPFNLRLKIDIQKAYWSFNLYKLKLPVKIAKFTVFNYLFWETIQSRGLRNTAKKFAEYLLLVIAIFTLENLIIKEHPQIAGIKFSFTISSIIFLAAVEVWSIGENFNKLQGKNPIKAISDYIIRKKSVEEILDESTKNK